MNLLPEEVGYRSREKVTVKVHPDSAARPGRILPTLCLMLLVLSPAAQAEPRRPTALIFHVFPDIPREGTELRVDGEVQALDGWGKPLELSPGAHQVDVIVRCREPSSHRLDLFQGQVHTLLVSLPPLLKPAPRGCPGHEAGASPPTRAGGLRTAGFIVGGAGIASLMLGGLVAGLAVSHARDASERGDLQAFNEQRTPYATGLVLAGLGAAALIAGAALVFSGPSSPPRTAWQVTPVVAPHQGGMWLSARW